MPADLVAPRRSRTRVFLRFLLFLVVLLLAALVGAGIWVYAAARAALPQLDGRLPVAGLATPVTVVRDAQGVPHISAANLDDLFFAQGYVTAQDRLWQMDVTRRYARGELSEILGEPFLKLDRRQRVLGLRATAERMLAETPPDERAQAQAYVNGVNAYQASHAGRLPLEFRILRYQPRPWTLVDCYAIGLNMAELLSHPFDGQVVHEKVLARLGAERSADLYPERSWRDHPPGADPKSLQPSRNPDDEDSDPARDSSVTRALPPASLERLRNLLDAPLTPGSNDWVVSGAHTVSGKPLLSNDMHLPHSIPNVWYEAHLQAGDFDVAGVTLPGNPYVVVGHNRRIAWGFTALVADVHDLFVETFNAAGQYQTPQGWRAPEHRREVIHIKGRPDAVLDVLVTRHGPVVTPLLSGEHRQLALQWTVNDTAGFRYPFFELDSARNWEEFRHALSQLSAPVLNVVYADVDGHIGYQAVGRIPLRKSGDGALPVPGADDAHEWSGYIPFDALPRVFDPPWGVLATANNRVTPDAYPYFVTGQWFPPYRAERIYRVLESGRTFSPADMLALQTDISSDFDRYCAERFVYAVEHAEHPSPRVRRAAELMRGWDGRLTLDSAAATLETRSRTELVRLLLQPHVGGLWGEVTSPDRPALMSGSGLEEILLHEPARWLPSGYKNYNDLLAAAVAAAVSEPEAPRNLAAWHWGEASPIVLQHPLFGRVPLLARWAGPGRQPQSGGSYTVKQVGRAFGPSERMTVDFSNLDGSTLNIVTGQSGQIFSPYFMDQWTAWYEGTTFPLPFSAEAVRGAAKHTLTLLPAR
ncbi:MAG TPA: penicillin acylase family protein [Terriglobales bacterium]|nr:penicillin acylase family protein [Terriglobales bacterium]